MSHAYERKHPILKVSHCVKIIIGKIYGKGVKLLLHKEVFASPTLEGR